MNEHPRLSAAGAGEHEQVSGGGGDGLALRVVQRFEDFGDVHYSALGNACADSRARSCERPGHETVEVEVGSIEPAVQRNLQLDPALLVGERIQCRVQHGCIFRTGCEGLRRDLEFPQRDFAQGEVRDGLQVGGPDRGIESHVRVPPLDGPTEVKARVGGQLAQRESVHRCVQVEFGTRSTSGPVCRRRARRKKMSAVASDGEPGRHADRFGVESAQRGARDVDARRECGLRRSVGDAQYRAGLRGACLLDPYPEGGPGIAGSDWQRRELPVSALAQSDFALDAGETQCSDLQRRFADRQRASPAARARDTLARPRAPSTVAPSSCAVAISVAPDARSIRVPRAAARSASRRASPASPTSSTLRVSTKSSVVSP